MNYSHRTWRGSIRSCATPILLETDAGAMARLGYIFGALCWLLVSLTPAQATVAAKLALGDAVVSVTAKVESCQKLTAPAPANHQCSGMPAQSAATARSRHDVNGKLAPAVASVALPLQLHADPFLPRVLPYAWTAIHSRRSNFWQIYAHSNRMRN